MYVLGYKFLMFWNSINKKLEIGGQILLMLYNDQEIRTLND